MTEKTEISFYFIGEHYREYSNMCHIFVVYFLSVVRTNYLSIFEQGKVKPSASSPWTTPENKHFSFQKYL